MTPKSLLRLPAATSTLDELSDGAFQPVIDDPELPAGAGQGHEARALLGQGLLRHRRAESRAEAEHVAIARVELLYPFAESNLAS